MIDLDKVMQTIRQEIESKRTAAGQGEAPNAPSAPPSDQRNKDAEIVVSPRPSCGRSLRQRLSLRRLVYRLLGIRELSRLEPELKRVRRGPIPLTALPFVVEEMKPRLAGAESAAKEVRELIGALGAQLQSLEGRVAAADANLQILSDKIARLDGPLGEHDRRLSEAQSRLVEVESKYHDNFNSIVDQASRLNALIDENRQHLHQTLNRDDLRIFASEGEKQLNALYVSFEDCYRGTHEDITQRQTIYMPYAKQAATATGGDLFVDIGCGRGEYLELLRTNHLNGLGVDQNSVMIAECHKRGLAAIEDDALAFLRNAAPASLAGVSGFHIIEHLPYAVLIDLFDEALRALAPGGLLIFETPNPANLLVAAERFYMDPTHLNPLPSEMVSFMAKARGFVGVTILPLHPVVNPPRQYDDPMLALLQEKIYGPQDYGLLAWKAK